MVALRTPLFLAFLAFLILLLFLAFLILLAFFSETEQKRKSAKNYKDANKTRMPTKDEVRHGRKKQVLLHHLKTP